MAKALNIPWDEEKIKKSHDLAEYRGHSSLAGYIKVYLTTEIKKMEAEKKRNRFAS